MYILIIFIKNIFFVQINLGVYGVRKEWTGQLFFQKDIFP